MKKFFLLIFGAFFFFVCSVMAQEKELAPLEEEQEEPEEELNAFGFPEKSLIKVIENKNIEEETVRSQSLPECNDAALLEQVRKTVAEHINFNGSTILTKRKALLTLKNIDNFVVLSQKDVGAKNHNVVAARLIELKINNHIARSDIEVCQSNNFVLKTKLYLVMYPAGQGKTKVEILNFAKNFIPTFVLEQ